MPNLYLDRDYQVGGWSTTQQQPTLSPTTQTTSAPQMSTNTPPVQAPTAPPMSQPLPPLELPAINGQQFVATPTGTGVGNGTAPVDVVNQMMSTLLDSNSRYIQDARLRGQEFANERGLLNSSIAAGASEREAIQGAYPLLAQAMGLHGQREQQLFQGQQSQLDRVQGVNNALLGSQLQERQAMLDSNLRQRLNQDTALQQDWLNSRDFSRQFNARISMMPINNAMDFTRMLSQYALDEPEVYTPQVISGMTNFLTQNMFSILREYFPSMITTTGTGG